MDESDASSFEVRFLEVDGKPLTVIGPTDAIAALERRLREGRERRRLDAGGERGAIGGDVVDAGREPGDDVHPRVRLANLDETLEVHARRVEQRALALGVRRADVIVVPSITLRGDALASLLHR